MMKTLTAPNLSETLPVRETIETEIGTIYFYDNLVVMEAKPNISLSIKNGLFILFRGIKMIGLRPVVYISNRVNDYAVDPNDYRFLEMVPNLKGIAIVTYNETSRQIAELESEFVRKPFATFTNLEHAKLWAIAILNK